MIVCACAQEKNGRVVSTTPFSSCQMIANMYAAVMRCTAGAATTSSSCQTISGIFVMVKSIHAAHAMLLRE